MQRMLGRLLTKATDDVSSQDLHDRALLYYRMLRSATDVSALESVVLKDSAVHGKFAEEINDYTELMEEFNSLSILYGKPSFNFIAEEYRVKYTKMPSEHPLPDAGPAATTHTIPDNPVAAPSASTASTPAAPVEEFDLLGFGGPPAPPVPASAPATSIALNPAAAMTGDDYQNKWSAMPDAQATVSTIPLPRLPANTDVIEAQLSDASVKTMASGELATEFKFYLYAADMNGCLYLIQSNIEKTAEPLMILTIKDMEGVGQTEQLVQAITKALSY